MLKRETVKIITRLVVQFGSGIIVRGTIENNVSDDLNPVQEIAVSAASFAIGGVVAMKAAAFTDQFVDEIFDAVNKAKATQK